MHRIAVLTNSMAQEAFLAEQLLRFCAEHCLFPQMDCYRDQETIFYKGIMPSETGFRFSSGL